MLWLPPSKLKIPAPIEVFPSLFNATGFATGLKIGPGSLLEPLSVKVTCPVGTPAPDFPTTSARTNTRLPKGSEAPLASRIMFPLLS